MNSSSFSGLQGEPLDPFDQALLDYFKGNTEALIRVYASDGLVQELPVQYFFRNAEELPPQEWMALSLCKGSVLDIGAGVGCHSLILQEQGLSVCALDISPTAAWIMQQRGIRDVRQADIYSWEGERFDTLLLLMNDIGLVKRLEELTPFLRSLHRLVIPGGQILLDSTDLAFDQEETATALGDYIGNIYFEVEYQGSKGSPYPWLFVDPDTLCRHAQQAGWYSQIIFQDDEGGYLARLVQSEPI